MAATSVHWSAFIFRRCTLQPLITPARPVRAIVGTSRKLHALPNHRAESVCLARYATATFRNFSLAKTTVRGPPYSGRELPARLIVRPLISDHRSNSRMRHPFRIIKKTPVVLPVLTITGSLAIGSSDVMVWEAAPIEHPLPQSVAHDHGWRSSSSRVSIEQRIATIGVPSFFAAAAIKSFGTRGFGGAGITPGKESGMSSMPGLSPHTPRC